MQKTVNNTYALGMVGEFYDDSPRRVTTFKLRKHTTVSGVKATGTLTATANFNASETVTIGSTTYTFGSGTGQIAVGENLATSLTSLASAINATGLVVAVATATTITLTAKEAGTAGNSIATTETCTNASFGGATLSGGVNEVTFNPVVARAYTYLDKESEAGVGGSGVFAGILVEPKEFARYNNFQATLTIPDGTTGSLCTFGHILVKVTDAIEIGDTAFYSTTDGTIKGGTAGSSIEGYVEIKNSKFVFFDASADGTAVLELN